MELCLDKSATIVDLQLRGFSEDFKVVGDRILWVQRKLFFRPEDFNLVEAHNFTERDGRELMVVGASLLPHFADGIFILHFEHEFDGRQVLINNKIKELLVKVQGFRNRVDYGVSIR